LTHTTKLPSFATRRSSDLGIQLSARSYRDSWVPDRPFGPSGMTTNELCKPLAFAEDDNLGRHAAGGDIGGRRRATLSPAGFSDPDRKSTRLNSSHSQISYA